MYNYLLYLSKKVFSFIRSKMNTIAIKPIEKYINLLDFKIPPETFPTFWKLEITLIILSLSDFFS